MFGDGQQNPQGGRERYAMWPLRCSSAAEDGGGSSLISHLLTEPHLALPGAGMKQRPDPLEWFLPDRMQTDGPAGGGVPPAETTAGLTLLMGCFTPSLVSHQRLGSKVTHAGPESLW